MKLTDAILTKYGFDYDRRAELFMDKRESGVYLQYRHFTPAFPDNTWCYWVYYTSTNIRGIETLKELKQAYKGLTGERLKKIK